ncbi:MAG: hypothetical protein WBD32_16965 [Acidobacteriaceae bacterium]
MMSGCGFNYWGWHLYEIGAAFLSAYMFGVFYAGLRRLRSKRCGGTVSDAAISRLISFMLLWGATAVLVIAPLVPVRPLYDFFEMHMAAELVLGIPSALLAPVTAFYLGSLDKEVKQAAWIGIVSLFGLILFGGLCVHEMAAELCAPFR